jgi:hypothetical protein
MSRVRWGLCDRVYMCTLRAEPRGLHLLLHVTGMPCKFGKLQSAVPFSIPRRSSTCIPDMCMGLGNACLQATRPGGMLVAEGAKYMLQLKAEQAEAFAGKVGAGA